MRSFARTPLTLSVLAVAALALPAAASAHPMPINISHPDQAVSTAAPAVGSDVRSPDAVALSQGRVAPAGDVRSPDVVAMNLPAASSLDTASASDGTDWGAIALGGGSGVLLIALGLGGMAISRRRDTAHGSVAH